MILTDTQQLVQQLYKDDKGEPVVLTPNQDALFSAIAKRKFPRLHVMCHTRWGKSMTVGLAADTVASTYPVKIAIVSGTKDKAKIIMDYAIQHIFDNDYTAGRFMPDQGEKVDDIRRNRNKSRINFKVGTKMVALPGVSNAFEKKVLLGEMFVGTASEALGFGADIVIEDEAALIDDKEHSLVVRMLGDNIKNNMLVKIGNPFTRNHFLKSYHDPKFVKFVIDCYKSLQPTENRMTQEIIEENKDYPFFKVLFECKFPSATEIDEMGWMALLTDLDIKTAQARVQDPLGKRKLGLDVARGGRNYNVWVMRQDNFATVVKKDLEASLVNTATNTENFMNELGIRDEDCFVDDSGVGGGVTDILKSRGRNITPVNFGEQASEPDKYANVRAEVYAGDDGVMVWIRTGGRLETHEGWSELLRIRYKKNNRGVTVIESKDDMRKRGIVSPDVADALALTFAKVKKSVYHGINPAKILARGGAASDYGGVGWDF